MPDADLRARCIHRFIWLIPLLWHIGFAAASDGASLLTFGAFPYLPAKQIEQIIAPVAARLGKLTGRPVTLLGRYALARQGIKVDVRAAGNHITCRQRLQVKRSAACITAWPPAKLFEQKNGLKLKLVCAGDSIPSSLFAIHSRVPSEQRKLMQQELLSWQGDNQNDTAYLANGAWARLYPAADEDYDIVREVGGKIGGQDYG
jgi:ABC-type phosphate/phosphonate transport system substrate-binding protein